MQARNKFTTGLLVTGLIIVAIFAGIQLKQKLSADVICQNTGWHFGYGYGSTCYDDGYGYGYGSSGYNNGGVDQGWIGYPNINAASFDDALNRLTNASDIADAKHWLDEASRWTAKNDRLAKENAWQQLSGQLTIPDVYQNSEKVLEAHADFAARAAADAKVYQDASKRVADAYAKRVKELSVPGAPTLTGIAPISAKIGETVTLTGTGFGTTNNDVLINGQVGQGTVRLSSSNGQIRFTVPSAIGPRCLFPSKGEKQCKTVPTPLQPGIYDITVKTATGTSAAQKLTITAKSKPKPEGRRPLKGE